MEKINWTQVLVFGLVVLVVFALGIGVLVLLFGGWGTMGSGMMGPGGMRGGWCPWCGGTGRGVGGVLAAVIGLSLGCLLPLALLALLILGIVWLTRNTGRDRTTSTKPAATCPTCGRPVEPDWAACPNCGEDLRHG